LAKENRTERAFGWFSRATIARFRSRLREQFRGGGETLLLDRHAADAQAIPYKFARAFSRRSRACGPRP